MSRKFYKWTVKWSSGSDYHTFYRPNNCGYTNDLNQAGIYNEDELGKCSWIIENEEDLERAKNNPDYHPVFAIPVDKVELLGTIQKTVRN